MIKIIIFDLWQTLAYRDVEKCSDTQMCEDSGSSISPKDFVKIFENSIQTKKRTDKYEAYSNLCKNMELPITEHNVNLLMNIRDNAEAKTKEYSYTISMLQQLKKLGYKIGLLSNSSVFAVEQIKKKTSILDYIDYPLFSFDVGVIKPDISFFKEMLNMANCKPEESIMIGDKINDDVLPPRQIGMNSILFENYEQLKKDISLFGISLK